MIIKTENKKLIATSLLAPPDHSGMGRRILNYLETLSKNHDIDCILATSSRFNSKNVKPYKYLGWPKYQLIKIPFVYKFLKYPISLVKLFIWFPISFLQSFLIVIKYPKASFLIGSARDPISFTFIISCIVLKREYCLGTSLNNYDDEKTLLSSKLSLIYKIFIKKSKHFILISPSLKTTKNSVAKSLKIIPNGVKIRNLNKENCQNLKKNLRIKISIPDRVTLLSVGRISRRKNSLEIFKLIKYLTDKNMKINLISIGPFELENDKYAQECKKYINENLLYKYIFNFGYQANTSIFYKASDIYISSSIAEGFPNAIIEAMSFSIPPIHSYLSQTSEYILGEKLSNQLTFKNSSQMYKLIKKYILDDQIRINTGRDCFERVSIFDIDKILFEYKKLLFK